MAHNSSDDRPDHIERTSESGRQEVRSPEAFGKKHSERACTKDVLKVRSSLFAVLSLVLCIQLAQKRSRYVNILQCNKHKLVQQAEISATIGNQRNSLKLHQIFWNIF